MGVPWQRESIRGSTMTKRLKSTALSDVTIGPLKSTLRVPTHWSPWPGVLAWAIKTRLKHRARMAVQACLTNFRSGNGKFLERTKCHSLVMPGWPSDSCKPFRLLWRPATEKTRDKGSAATFSFPDLCLTSYANIPSSARQAWMFEFLILPRLRWSNMNANNAGPLLRWMGDCINSDPTSAQLQQSKQLPFRRWGSYTHF